MSTDYCVFICRVQPVHTAHLQLIMNALDEAKEVIVVIGSHRAPISLKNPWTYEQRVAMVTAALDPSILERVHFVPARDYLYCQLTWLTGVQNAVSQITGPDSSVKLLGHFKDDSSFYLKLFPQWELAEQPNYFGANSTDIREELFSCSDFTGNKLLHPSTVVTLQEYTKTEKFAELCKEHAYLKEYRKRWEDAPFEPVFVTTDAVVVQAGHVLLIERGMNPG